MKKYLLAFTLLMSMLSFDNKVQAQSLNISVNIGSQPAWGPVGYDYVEYYYFPEINCYYNVINQRFFYLDRGRWVSDIYLPYSYRNFDLYSLYKVVINVNQPWLYNTSHRQNYGRYVGRHNQIVIRDSRDNRYRASRNNKYVWYSPNHRPSPGHNQPNTRPTPPRNEVKPNHPSGNNSHNRPNSNDRKPTPDNGRVNSNNRSSSNRGDRPKISNNSRDKQSNHSSSSQSSRNSSERDRR